MDMATNNKNQSNNVMFRTQPTCDMSLTRGDKTVVPRSVNILQSKHGSSVQTKHTCTQMCLCASSASLILRHFPSPSQVLALLSSSEMRR